MQTRLAQLEGVQQSAGQEQPSALLDRLFDKYSVDENTHREFRDMMTEFADLNTRQAVESTLQYLQPVLQGVTQDHQTRTFEEKKRKMLGDYGKGLESIWPSLLQEAQHISAQLGQTVDPEWVFLNNHREKALTMLTKEQNSRARKRRENSKRAATEGFTQARRTSAPGSHSGQPTGDGKPKIPTAAEIVAAIEADSR
jgi:hypothetical protein